MLFILAGILFLLFLYLRHVERGLQAWPDDAQKLAPKRWSKTDIQTTYDRVSKKPIDWTPHLPPKLDRRYVIVGGSGLVGGYLVLHLLARGQSPESIRIIDFRKSLRKDLQRGKALEVGFVQADITSADSIREAFQKPWHSSVANLPLTVFHTAAVIRPGTRRKILYSQVSTVNVLGCANTVAAARAAGAGIFIATSSGSIAIRPLKMWIPPWQKYPSNMVQVYPDPDKDQNIREPNQYFGSYAQSKAQAEEIVMTANTNSFKTGCVRPACGVYGNQYDLTVGAYMKARTVPSWIPNIAQSFVHAENVSLGHLCHERAILTAPEKTSGRAFTVTDAGTAPQFRDIYNLCVQLTGFKWTFIPSLSLLPLAYLVETYTVARVTVPGLKMVLPEINGDIKDLQPALWSITGSHQFALNDQAALLPEEGGIGFKPVCTTLEGMAFQAKNWNDEFGTREPVEGTLQTVRMEIKNVAKAVAAAKP